MKTVKMTPQGGGTPINKSGTGAIVSLDTVPYGTYAVEITQDGYETYTGTYTVDEPTENFVVTMVKSIAGDVVFDSRTQTIDFTANVANIYLVSTEIKLGVDTKYILETDFPGDLWVTNNLYLPTQSKVLNKKSEPVTTTANGNFGIVTRPAVDGDGTSYPYNATQFEDKTYYFVIREVVD